MKQALSIMTLSPPILFLISLTMPQQEAYAKETTLKIVTFIYQILDAQPNLEIAMEN